METSGAGRLGLRVRKSRDALIERRWDLGMGWTVLDSVQASVEEVENVVRELFVCGSRCGGVGDGCSQNIGDAGRLKACRGCEKGDVRCEVIGRLF